MATVALWHLGVTGILAGALGMVIMVQALGDGLRRMRRTPQARTVPAPVRPAAEPRPVRTAARTAHEQAPAMASAAGAR